MSAFYLQSISTCVNEFIVFEYRTYLFKLAAWNI